LVPSSRGTLMNSILPLQDIERRFDKPVRLDQMGIDRLGEIAGRDPNAILNTAFTVWQRHVRKNPALKPSAVQDHVRRHGGSFLEAARAVIGEPIIRDISFSRCTVDDPALDDNQVAYLLVAHVYPNDVHIADVNLVNPYKPIPAKRRKHKFRKYKGLGLLGTVLLRTEDYARAHACELITLTAAADDLVPLFGKFGFVVEDDEVASLAMVKKVSPVL
jgi:hypothetical protein